MKWWWQNKPFFFAAIIEHVLDPGMGPSKCLLRFACHVALVDYYASSLPYVLWSTQEHHRLLSVSCQCLGAIKSIVQLTTLFHKGVRTSHIAWIYCLESLAILLGKSPRAFRKPSGSISLLGQVQCHPLPSAEELFLCGSTTYPVMISP